MQNHLTRTHDGKYSLYLEKTGGLHVTAMHKYW